MDGSAPNFLPLEILSSSRADQVIEVGTRRLTGHAPSPVTFNEATKRTNSVFMATTFESVIRLNSERQQLPNTHSTNIRQQLLQLLRSTPRDFQSKTPLSAKDLLNRYLLSVHTNQESIASTLPCSSIFKILA